MFGAEVERERESRETGERMGEPRGRAGGIAELGQGS